MKKLKGSFEKFKVVHPKDVFVKANYKEKFEQESTGIILTIAPSVVDDRPTSGIVLGLGSDIADIHIGDTIHFEKTAGWDLYFEDNSNEWFIVMDYERIYGVEKAIG